MYSVKTKKENKTKKIASSFLLFTFLFTQLFSVVPINAIASENSEQSPVCDPTINLVENGGFENPILDISWDIFESVSNWSIDWTGNLNSFENITRPEPSLEIQKNVESWGPSEGLQYAELDTDWDGNDGPVYGEPSSVTIWQNLETVPGTNYELSFDFSARPGTPESDNVLEVKWGGSTVGPNISVSGEGKDNTDWNKHTFELTADSENTELRFTDLGLPNSLGTFVDNVSVTCVPTVEPEPEPDPELSPACLIPSSNVDALDDTVKETIGTPYNTSELLIGEIIENAGYFGVDVVEDQTQYQIWQSEKDNTNINVKFLDRYAVQNAVFGYYKDGDTLTFVPVFRSGSVTGYESVPAFVKSESIDFSITGTGNVSFAIITQSGETQTLYSTENSKNNGDDHALVYHVEDNKYIIGFEDLPLGSADKDYQDIVVLIDVLNCSSEEENTPPTITLTGANPLEIVLGSEFTDPGATADDLEDGDLTDDIVVTGGTLDTLTLGTYTLTYNVEDSEGLSTSVTRDVVVVEINFCELIENQNGWLGSYFDYAQSHPNMNLPTDEWGTEYGDPLSDLNSWTTDWYNNKYFKFAQVDSDLDFGSDFFPMDIIEPDEGKVYGHNFYFGIHFQAKVTVPVEGDYEYYLTSDDDSWVYIDGKLAIQNKGVHAANTQLGGNLHLKGTQIIDVFFAERHITQSNLVFKIIGDGIVIKPYSENCESANTPPTITLTGANPLNILINTPFVDPGATADDLEDGDLTSAIIVDGTVSTTTLGSYNLTYSVYDSEGLGATTTREVIVYEEVVEKSICSDGLDNDGDNKIDSTDPGCHTDNNPDNPDSYDPNDDDETDNPVPPIDPPVTPPTNGGGGGGIGGHRRDIRNLLSTQGEILGATSCLYLIDYIKIDWVNDPIEVLKVQSFLNVFEGESLSYTGVYNQATFEAVERFQTKYASDILIPWGDKVTTGFVYILTKKKINEIYCDTLYPISQNDQNEIDAFRTSGGNNLNVNTTGATGYLFDQNSGSSNVLYAGDNVDKNIAEISVINLKDNSSTTATTTGGSVLRNVAVSLFAFPKKIFEGFSYLSLIILLILLAIIVAIARLFMSSDDSKDDSDNTATSASKITNDKKDSPVIVLPGVLPDEEIIVENPDEDSIDVVVNTPDLR